MSRRTAESTRRAEWERSTAQALHRAGEHNAAAVGAQFDVPLLLAALSGEPGATAPTRPGRLDGRVLNVRPDPVDFRDATYVASLIRLDAHLLPAPLAPRDVRDQGSEGSCTGQALAAVIDLQNVGRRVECPTLPARVSARMLYESARVFDEYADDDLPGSSVRGAIKGFFHRGVCGTDLAPYFPGDIGWRLGVERAKAARRVTLGAYMRLRHVLNDYHAALAEAGALLCSSMIHEGWSKDAVRAAAGEIRPPGERGGRAKLTGAHAFAIVGYTPDGFIVLNSWGPDWGGFTPLRRGERGGEALPGMALWTYEDWCEHVLDTWVLRLQVPANLPSGFAGGFHLVRRPTELHDDPMERRDTPVSAPARDITGHFVNIADGRFVAAPPYDNDARTFQETARFLIGNEDADEANRYDHLLLYAHGGLGDVGTAAARAAYMVPIFKQNGIYPVFFLWHTGLGETAADVLRRLFEGTTSRAGGFTSLSDRLLETAARPAVRPLWREMKDDAHRSFARAAEPERDGAGWQAMEALLGAARHRTRHPLRLHLIGHSAGAIFLGEMLARARLEGLRVEDGLRTVSLFAPACTDAFFDDTLGPVASAMPAGAFTVYNLTEVDERDDDVAGLYRKSLLHLVSNALEEKPGAPLTGLEERRKTRTGVRFITSTPRLGRGRVAPESRAARHGEFDNDTATMNHVLARILGRPAISESEGGFSEADLKGHGF